MRLQRAAAIGALVLGLGGIAASARKLDGMLPEAPGFATGDLLSFLAALMFVAARVAAGRGARAEPF
ncbi:MAG TPA: hypothetical protein VI997_09665 [Candidatus Thermoplasmatota archaeon]|nr:hypothetical protein [Candidatus Thermoplasmatota archaeon]